MANELERVLVGVDGSEAGLWSAERAARLRRSGESVVTLLHVVARDLQLAPLLEALAEDEAPAMLHGAEQIAREVAAASGRSLHVTTAFCRGVPFVEIHRRAREDQAELIVVGRGDKRRGSLIGSTAERVVRGASSAVLVVANHPSAPYRRPLVAVDLSPTCQRAVAMALRLIDATVTTIDVVHARHKDQSEAELREAILAFLAQVGGAHFTWKVVIREGDPRQIILDEAARQRSDLLVLGTLGRGAIAQLLLGSVAEAVVRVADCDVLVARPEAPSFVMP
jgi:nucleotide-binding universal stress UspA family protein